MHIENHIDALKSILQKQKEMDINEHVNDWIALLHFQSLNGDGLYAPLEHMEIHLSGNISAYVKGLNNDELRALTQEAFEKVNVWKRWAFGMTYMNETLTQR